MIFLLIRIQNVIIWPILWEWFSIFTFVMSSNFIFYLLQWHVRKQQFRRVLAFKVRQSNYKISYLRTVLRKENFAFIKQQRVSFAQICRWNVSDVSESFLSLCKIFYTRPLFCQESKYSLQTQIYITNRLFQNAEIVKCQMIVEAYKLNIYVYILSAIQCSTRW